MDNTAIWFIGIAMKIGYEKSKILHGVRDTVEKMLTKHRVTNDMTIGDNLLELLLRPSIWLRRLDDSGDLVLQYPHCMWPNGGKEGQNGKQQSMGVVSVETTTVHLRVGVHGVGDVCR